MSPGQANDAPIFPHLMAELRVDRPGGGPPRTPYDSELLFVYSPPPRSSPPRAGEPHGYTKFRAFALLNNHGDMSAATKAILKKGNAA